MKYSDNRKFFSEKFNLFSPRSFKISATSLNFRILQKSFDYPRSFEIFLVTLRISPLQSPIILRLTCPIESSTILLNHPWSPSNRSITYDISFPRLSSKIYRISCQELAPRYISPSLFHLLSIDHKKKKKKKYSWNWNQPIHSRQGEKLISRNNSISTLSLIEGKVWTQKFTQSTKSTVHQGSTQRLIPLREESLLLNEEKRVFLSRRSLPRHRSRDVDSSIPKRPPPPPPFLPFCVIITGCYNYHGKHEQDARSFRFFELFPPSSPYPARYFSSLVSVLAAETFCQFAVAPHHRAKVSGEFIRLKLCERMLRIESILFDNFFNPFASF